MKTLGFGNESITERIGLWKGSGLWAGGNMIAAQTLDSYMKGLIVFFVTKIPFAECACVFGGRLIRNSKKPTSYNVRLQRNQSTSPYVAKKARYNA
jgi:hypothetical protein